MARLKIRESGVWNYAGFGQKGTDATSYTWKGPWATSTIYAVNDLVQNDGSSYICTSGHTSASTTEPNIGVSWTDKWDLFVEKGDISITTAKCRAYLNQAQNNLADVTNVKVNLNAENYDPGGYFDATTDYDFTAPISGYYLCIGQVTWTSCVADKRYGVTINVDGTTVAQSWDANGSGTAVRVCVSTIEYLAANQVVTLGANHASGAATEDLATDSSNTFLAVHLMST